MLIPLLPTPDPIALQEVSEFERDLRDECVCGVAAAMYSGFAFTGSEKKFRKMNVHAAALLCLLFLQR